MKVDKTKFKDEKGRYIVQGLFLELGYKHTSYFTLDGEDKTYKGKVYPSLKKLFIELRDPEGYIFANEYLFDWRHWKRIKNNATLAPHIEEWEEELEMALRSDGIQTIIDAAVNANSYQAGKWLADRGWQIKKAGRPSKKDLEDSLAKDKKDLQEIDADVSLLEEYRKAK